MNIADSEPSQLAFGAAGVLPFHFGNLSPSLSSVMCMIHFWKIHFGNLVTPQMILLHRYEFVCQGNLDSRVLLEISG